MNNANPPVVWQIIFNRHYTKEFNALEDIKQLHVALLSYPLSYKVPFNEYQNFNICTYGIFFKERFSKSGVVSDVADGSWADKQGVKSGYVLKKMKTNSYSESSGKGKEPSMPSNSVEMNFDKLKIKDESCGYNISTDLIPDYFYIEEESLDE